MNVENSFSIILLTTSVLMFFTGWWQTKKPPKYQEDFKMLSKSKRAGRSSEHWYFSLSYGGNLYLKFAGILFGLGILGFLLNFQMMVGFILAISIVVIGVAVIGLKTEKALVNKFGK
ncbi:hypothetical protein LRR18_03915 [Mangrovimonas sp. AS39]|uniref:hypothetical protein n=1 Tax=Mangrovimonas TaxID=1211036 RepID=UPI0006B5AD44|nr:MULTISPECIES: hypothetical protein [Mangrovimonas]MCF1190721.1 hypothetical protein [Mangrovimonas futianensis]MCF1194418.1 hypothetical protein [Mangrovimonas futianensis]